MGQQTAISWCDHTFNPWWGCVKVSPACDHCYAETFSKRVGLKVWGHDSERRFFGPEHWLEPERWNRAAERARTRRRVFCASMADVFEDRPELALPRMQLFNLIEKWTPWLDWLLLTKRPANILRMVPNEWRSQFPSNVWIGTTAEDQHWLDVRARYLADVPAIVRFLSYEPALGPLTELAFYTGGAGARFHWVIAGGESGHHARAMKPEWVRFVRDTCIITGTPFHFKQWGGVHPKANGCELDGREWKEFPLNRTSSSLL